jgi:NADPH-dependent curcumin reductase CurA
MRQRTKAKHRMAVVDGVLSAPTAIGPLITGGNVGQRMVKL